MKTKSKVKATPRTKTRTLPGTKVVRWEPTEDQESKLWDAIHGALDSTDAKWDTVLRWLRDCQRDLPAVEPSTPEDAKSRRIDELERLLVQIGDYAHDKSTGPAVEDGYWEIRSMAYDGIPSDLPPTPPTDRFAALESRLAALENRAILKPDYDPRDVALVSVPRIGKATYNTPTTLEQALTVETQVAPEPEIPLPEGCAEIEGFPLLCKDASKRIRTRSGWDVFPWYDSKVKNMRDRGMPEACIKQAARYAIEQIAKDAGMKVTVK